jgi:hypothetical protein
MDDKKWIQDRKNEAAREKEEKKEKEKLIIDKKKKDIETVNAQAHILDKFIKEIVNPCFEEREKIFDNEDYPCGVKLFCNPQTETAYAIQITFSKTAKSKKSEMDHNTWPHLKYEFEGAFDEVDDNPKIERDTLTHPLRARDLRTFDTAFLSSPGMIDKHIDELLEAMAR